MRAAPREVDVLAVGRDAEHLRVAVARTRGSSLPNAAISVGQTNVKSFGQKKYDLPLAVVRRLR